MTTIHENKEPLGSRKITAFSTGGTIHMNNTFEIDNNHIWQSVFRILEERVEEKQVSHQQFQAWLKPLSLLNIQNSDNGLIINILSPNDFTTTWVKDNYYEDIVNAFKQITGQFCQISFKVDSSSNSAAVGISVPSETLINKETNITYSDDLCVDKGSLLLENRYSFETFIVGASNQFAHASSYAVAKNPGKQYNPLFIYSTPGLGKTHLLYAIGNHVLLNNPNIKVAYLSAEYFVNELINSIPQNKMFDFRKKYRENYDVLLIDDIHFFAGKEKTQEEFFHTFNSLYASKRQIVVTSDSPPKKIAGLEERIRTRFESGLVVDIAPPEIETRIAILRTKAEHDDIYLPDDVANFLASYIKTNVRELEGVLIRLQAQSSLTGAEISLEMAKRELKAVLPKEGSQFTVETIQSAVIKHFNIRIQDLKSSTRSRSVALPRQIAMYLIKKYTGITLKEIGNYFGGKDHTTIIHACKKIEENIEKNHKLREDIEAIQNLL